MSVSSNNSDRTDGAAVNIVTLADTWQLRFDIPVDPDCSEVAKEFARSFTEFLEAQKLTSVVSSDSHPKEIQIQVCITPVQGELWAGEVEQVIGTLQNLSTKRKAEVEAECLKVDSDEWQGFRLWMTFDRQQAEKLFTRKKPKRRFFGSRVFKKLYSGKH